MAKKYLDYDGLLYFWQKIKVLFVSDVAYDSTSKKIQKTKAGTTSDLVTLSTVATSGSYNDLSNKPTIPSATSTSPKMDGTAAVGTETAWAKGDHVHPSDTTKVDKETGKGLSTNDYTTAEKNKLSGIASGAEVNVQSDWNQTTTTADDYIKNKPTINGQVFYGTLGEYEQTATSTRTYSIAANNFELKTGNIILFYWAKVSGTASVSINLNVNGTGSLALKTSTGSATTISYSQLNDASRVYAAVYTGENYKLLGYFDKDTTYPEGTASQIETGTNTVDRVWSAKILSDYVTGKVGSIPVATTSANGLMSSTDKTKLDGIASGAEVNQNAFSNVTVGSTTVAADSKTDTLALSAGTNISITANASDDMIMFEVDDMPGRYSVSEQSGGIVRITDTQTLPNVNFDTAAIASPTFTGTPKAPTATAGTNTTQIATTAFVKTAVDTAVTGATAYQGIAPTSFAPTNYKAGWYWIIGTAGTYCGQTCEAGDMIFCKTAASTYAAANFDVVQTNLDITSITNAEIDTILAA